MISPIYDLYAILSDAKKTLSHETILLIDLCPPYNLEYVKCVL